MNWITCRRSCMRKLMHFTKSINSNINNNTRMAHKMVRWSSWWRVWKGLWGLWSRTVLIWRMRLCVGVLAERDRRGRRRRVSRSSSMVLLLWREKYTKSTMTESRRSRRRISALAISSLNWTSNLPLVREAMPSDRDLLGRRTILTCPIHSLLTTSCILAKSPNSTTLTHLKLINSTRGLAASNTLQTAIPLDSTIVEDKPATKISIPTKTTKPPPHVTTAITTPVGLNPNRFRLNPYTKACWRRGRWGWSWRKGWCDDGLIN